VRVTARGDPPARKYLQSRAYDLSRHRKVETNERLMLRTADYLIETADRCIRLANTGRRLVEELDAVGDSPEAKAHCARIAAAGREALSELETIGQDLLAKAVDLDTERQKSSPGSFGP
jgi:hypothetical protein